MAKASQFVLAIEVIII